MHQKPEYWELGWGRHFLEFWKKHVCIHMLIGGGWVGEGLEEVGTKAGCRSRQLPLECGRELSVCVAVGYVHRMTLRARSLPVCVRFGAWSLSSFTWH